jgi:phosphoglycolate phosphatase-like HAD superfamily hydrolase
MANRATTGTDAVQRVVMALAERREQLVSDVVSGARDSGTYGRLDADQLADFAETVRKGFDAILRAMAEDRSFTDEDVRFLWPHIRSRTRAGVTEAEMLAVVRLFQRRLWDAIAELAGTEEDGRAAAFILARPLIDYIDVLSRVVNEAFAEAKEAIASRVSVVRRELIETLLSGAEPAPGPLLNAARASGLSDGCQLVVVVARPVAPAVDKAALPTAAQALARAAQDVVEPLGAVRGTEIVIVRPTADDEAKLLAESLQNVYQRLTDEGLQLAIGISTVHEGLGEVPAAYQEACVALERVSESGGVLGLSGLAPLDYLVLRAGDRTAWRLVPPAVRSFVEEDARQGGTLRDAVLAYVESDLNVKLAAERLFVHPNTAHYRLSRIEERTGLSARRFADLLLLLIAIRLGGADSRA